MAVELAASEYGEGKPVAILHGLFGSGRNWTSLAQRLAERFRVIVFDLRNHGASPWANAMDYRAMAGDVRAAMQTREHQRYALLGHSMGGKTAMVAALVDPAAVERLVVVDIAPIVQPAASFAGYIRAMRALDLGAIGRRRDADTALATAIPDPAARALLLQNLVLGDGPPRWRLNLPALEAALPAITDFPGFPPGTRYGRSALFIAGGRSEALAPESEPAVRALFPSARIARIAEAGHWVHAERPAEFLAVVEPFLAG